MPFSFSQSDHPLPVDFNTPSIPGLRIPNEFHWVIPGDTPLAGMQLPNAKTPWETLFALGFRRVACLCTDRPRYMPDPLKWLVAIELSDLIEKPRPSNPEKEEEAITVIASAIADRLEHGEGVIVHCAGGRGRTGTVLGVTLKKLGYTNTEVVSFLDSVHRARNKRGWPEAPWQQQVVERASLK